MKIRYRTGQCASLSLVLVFLLIVTQFAPALGQRAKPGTGLREKRPKLILLIAVDQFRYDYLERFGDLFGENGLKRLMRDGAFWVNSNYDHMPTSTAPGHATMMTGAYPAETGIVGNDWPDRTTGKRVTSVSDDTVKSLGANEPSASPRRLMSSTLGDELRLATNDRSKVIGISLKDRSAILPAGRHANAAYWFSTGTGNMVSSTYYFNQLPTWVNTFNDSRPADKYFGAKWERLLPESEYLKRTGTDSPPWEDIGNPPGDTNTFPHVITGGATKPGNNFYGALDYSPFSNDLLVSFAELTIANEQLGQHDDTDVLTLSLSANDYVGHRFGPYSQEVMDCALRVDRQIGSLLDYVQSRIGINNTIVIFTADHGMAPTPEHASALGLSGGRIKSTDIINSIRAAIKARYNPQPKNPDSTADYILRFDESGTPRETFSNSNLYFNYAALKRDNINLDEIEQVAGEAALTVPGMSRYFTRSQLQRGEASITDPIERRAIHGFYPTRSGDLILVAEPFKYVLEYPINATHGTPYSYDTHVPLIIMGPGLSARRYFEPSSPADIAPTIAALLGIQPPSSATGRVLVEAIAK